MSVPNFLLQLIISFSTVQILIICVCLFIYVVMIADIIIFTIKFSMALFILIWITVLNDLIIIFFIKIILIFRVVLHIIQITFHFHIITNHIITCMIVGTLFIARISFHLLFFYRILLHAFSNTIVFLLLSAVAIYLRYFFNNI